MNAPSLAWATLLLPLSACFSREYVPDGDLKRPIGEFQRLLVKRLQIDPALAAKLKPEGLEFLQKVAEAFPKDLHRKLVIRRILDAPEGSTLSLEGCIRALDLELDQDPGAGFTALWTCRIETAFTFRDENGVVIGTGRGTVMTHDPDRDVVSKNIAAHLGKTMYFYLRKQLKPHLTPEPDEEP